MSTLTKIGTISGKLTPDGSLNGKLTSSGSIGGSLSQHDYNTLRNKPSLNGVTIQGRKNSNDYSLATVYYNTTENWNESGDVVSEENTIYVYTDYKETESGTIAGIKVGDGKTTISNLPFNDMFLEEHISDSTVHIDQEERDSWNEKVRAYVDGDTLILTTH